jgi:excisionase family DNA binding protein
MSGHEAPERMLTVKQVADLLQLSPDTIYRYANKGTIPSHKIGGVWRFVESEIMASRDSSVDDWARNSRQRAKTKRKESR